MSSTSHDPIRSQLIGFSIEFIRTAIQLPGVLRVAMIGSLPTAKPSPKDADFLVTVADDADLTLLAQAARRLQGRAMSIGRGGEAFLADPQGNYVGRVCPWKVCAPGVRMRCDALHCGQRPFLHDDFTDIKLSKQVIAEPRLEIWPEYQERSKIADDLRDALAVALAPA